MYESSNTNSKAHSEKLAAEIKKAFSKLNDADIALYATAKDKFFEVVKTKCSIERAEAEKTLKKLDAECAAACSANKDKSTTATAQPAQKPKVA